MSAISTVKEHVNQMKIAMKLNLAVLGLDSVEKVRDSVPHLQEWGPLEDLHKNQDLDALC